MIGLLTAICPVPPAAAVTNTVSPGFISPTYKGIKINKGSYMSAHVLLNLLNELGKRDKMQGLPSILSLFRNKFNKFNNTRAQMLDSIYHMMLKYFNIEFLV